MGKKPEPKGAKPFKAGLVKIRMIYTSIGLTNSYKANNVMYAQFSDGINHSVADLQSLATNWRTKWGTRMLPGICNAWQLFEVDALSLGGDGLLASDTTAVVGGAAGNPLPPQCCIVLSWRAGATWRGGRPRTYLPGVQEAQLTVAGSATLNNASMETLDDAAANFLTDMAAFAYTGATALPSMASFYSNYSIRPVPLVKTITDVVVHDRLASQRRRSGKEAIYGVA